MQKLSSKDVIKDLDITQTTASQFMKIMEKAGVFKATTEKSGKASIYQANGDFYENWRKFVEENKYEPLPSEVVESNQDSTPSK